MKSFLKNKKAIVITSVILLIAIIGGSCFFLFGGKDNKLNNDKVLKEGEYVAYVKINPLVKLTFKSSYYECEDKDGKVNLCEKFTNEVIGTEFLNDDAKSIYKDLDFKGKSLNEAIVLLAKTAENKDYDITNIVVNANWNYIDHIKKEVIDQIKKETNVEVEIKFNYQKSIDESLILEQEKVKSYTASFDTDGGTNVESQIIKENNKVTKPSDPTKKGYTFDGWYLDDKKYDFDSNVTKDITLKARWKKENTGNNNSETTKPNNTEQGNNNSGSQLSKKEQDNETLKKQLKEKGLVWDANSREEAYRILDKWAAAGGYAGDVIESSYGDSDTAYTVKITLDSSLCGGNGILNIDWRNSNPVDFVYYLHSKGYNCSGNTGYYNGKSFHINDKNEIVWD